MSESKKSAVSAHPVVLSVYFLLNVALFLITVFLVWRNFFIPAGLAPNQIHNLKMVVYTFCFGGIGGTTYSIYGLYKHTVEKDFDSSYFYWYLFRGPLGAILGLILFFLLKGGLLVLSPESTQSPFQAKALFVSAAFLAGFSINQFISKLKQLSQTIWGVKSHKEKGQ